MLWKLLGIDRLIDTLFDNAWSLLDLPGNDCLLDDDTPLPSTD